MIGENIKKLRVTNNLTQKELADKLFVTAQAISRWEKEEVEPSIGTIKEMSKIFNVSTDEIIGIPTKKEQIEVIKKEYVYKEPPRQALATCEVCNKLIYDSNDLIRWNTGRHKTPHVCCRKCKEEREARIHDEKIYNSEKRRSLSFILGIISAIIVFIVFLTIGIINKDNMMIIVGTIFTILAFTMVSCLVLNNNFLGELMLELFELGFVKMPGVIFSLDLDGIIWLITIKLLLFIGGIFLAICAGILAIAIGAGISIFVYPFAIYKNIKHPELD